MAVDWSYFNKFDKLDDKYLPAMGEGDNMATQMNTAITKLVYKWYNDGDVFDNTHYLDGWCNDLSTYANWLAKYIPGAKEILKRIETCYHGDKYEDLLKDLCDTLLTEELLTELEQKPKIDSIYKCEGEFEFREDYDEDDEW